MTPNIKVRNFIQKHRSYITLAAHTDTALFAILEIYFQEMYDLGHADGYAEAWSESNRLEEENGNL